MDKEARRAVIERLTGLGYVHVIEAQSLRCLLVQPDDRLDETISQYYRRNSDRIRQAETLFSDERSVTIYRNNVQAHASGDYSHHGQWESPMMQQYFPEDVRLTKGYKRFLDCGGYTGDTIAEVIRHEGEIEALRYFVRAGHMRCADCIVGPNGARFSSYIHQNGHRGRGACRTMRRQADYCAGPARSGSLRLSRGESYLEYSAAAEQLEFGLSVLLEKL